jgi:hypothetical protein
VGVNESDPGRGRFQKLAVGLELEASLCQGLVR